LYSVIESEDTETFGGTRIINLGHSSFSALLLLVGIECVLCWLLECLWINYL